MKIKDIVIKEEEYQGHKYMSVYLITTDNEQIRLGTIKGKDNKYIITPQKREYK